MTTEKVNKTNFSTASGHKLLKNQTGKRVAKDASIELLEDLEEYGQEISEKALEFAESAGRKTVRAEDVRKALKVME